MADIAPMHIGNNPNHNKVCRPLFPEIGVVAFVPEKWGGPWLSRHQVLTRLSKYFHVLWAEPAQSWRELVLGGGKAANSSSSWRCSRRALLCISPKDGCLSLAGPPG